MNVWKSCLNICDTTAPLQAELPADSSLLLHYKTAVCVFMCVFVCAIVLLVLLLLNGKSACC